MEKLINFSKAPKFGNIFSADFIKITFISIFILSLFGCNKHQADYPGISIYKTRGDYFNMVRCLVKGNHIYMIPCYYLCDGLVFSDTDTLNKRRIRLANGYVLDTEGDEWHDTYLNLTFKQYLLKESETETHLLTIDTLKKHIIDTDPYTVYYRETKYPQKYLPPNILNDTAELNTIIRNGELEKYFERIK